MRPNDFHGRRAYASDGSDQGLVSRASVVIAWIKLQLGRLSHDVSTVVLSRPSRRMGDGFSLLGLDQRHVHLRELDTSVFPMDRGRPVAAKPSKQVKARE
jgi:hypothetical protein